MLQSFLFPLSGRVPLGVPERVVGSVMPEIAEPPGSPGRRRRTRGCCSGEMDEAHLCSCLDQRHRVLSLVGSTTPGLGLRRGWRSGSRAVGAEAQSRGAGPESRAHKCLGQLWRSAHCLGWLQGKTQLRLHLGAPARAVGKGSPHPEWRTHRPPDMLSVKPSLFVSLQRASAQ